MSQPEPQTRGPSWRVPVELLRGLVGPHDTKRLVEMSLRQARIQPHATVALVEDRFIATISFEEPKYPGRAQIAVFRLCALPQENSL